MILSTRFDPLGTNEMRDFKCQTKGCVRLATCWEVRRRRYVARGYSVGVRESTISKLCCEECKKTKEKK